MGRSNETTDGLPAAVWAKFLQHEEDVRTRYCLSDAEYQQVARVAWRIAALLAQAIPVQKNPRGPQVRSAAFEFARAYVAVGSSLTANKRMKRAARRRHNLRPFIAALIVAAFLATALMPPWIESASRSYYHVSRVRYAFLTARPKPFAPAFTEESDYAMHVDWSRLLMEWVALGFTVGGAWVVVRSACQPDRSRPCTVGPPTAAESPSPVPSGTSV
jgi:hypothetical protein